MITKFKVFEINSENIQIYENVNYTWESIITLLSLDMFEDLSDYQKMKKYKIPLDAKKYEEIENKELLNKIILYFEYKYEVKLKKFDKIFSTFVTFHKIIVSTIGIFFEYISKHNTPTRYKVAHFVEDKDEFVNFINNPEMFIQSNKYNL